jgi:hypothetical protein
VVARAVFSRCGGQDGGDSDRGPGVWGSAEASMWLIRSRAGGFAEAESVETLLPRFAGMCGAED